MSDEEAAPPFVRIRTAEQRKKALAQLAELRANGQVESALVIVQRKDGDIEVLGQEMRPYEVPRLLYAATMAIQDAEGGRVAAKLEPHVMPLSWLGLAGPARKTKEVITSADGTLVPPPGEHFISCGECRHPRFYVLFDEKNDSPRRFSCAHCGNEIKMIQVHHGEGRA